MTETLNKPTPKLSADIRRKLGRLRAAIRQRLLIEGLAWLIVATVIVALGSLLVDFGLYRLTRQHMTVAQRMLILLACEVILASILWRKVIRPQRVRISEDDLALVVERANPDLSDRLISALQFSRTGAPGASDLLVEKILEQAEHLAKPLRFTDAVRSDRLLKHAGAALLAVALFAGFFALKPALMNTWLHRVAMLRNDEYPRDTKLTIDGPTRLRIGRGSALEIAVTAAADKVVPADVTFHMTFPSVGKVDESVPPTAADRARFTKKFEVVNEPFTFYVTGGDDRTSEITVEVAEPPQIRDVNFTIVAPSYTHLPPRPASSAQGLINVPIDSVVNIAATATKDLAEATLLLDGVPAQKCTITKVGSPDGDRPRGIECQITAAAPKPFKPAISVRFALIDAEGFKSAHGTQYTLMLQPDKPPAVQIAAVGVSGQVSTRAMIPVQITAKDEYGIKSAELEWSVLSAAEKRMRVPARTFTPDEKEPKPFQVVLDLQQIASAANSQPGKNEDPKVAAASPISVGESIRILGLASDTLPAPDGPNLGVSNPITLKIVSDEELLTAMVETQRSLREQFRQAVTSQAEAKGKTDAAAERAREKDGLGDAQRLAGESADSQQQITDRVSAMAARFEEILLQMANNRVGNDSDKHRLQDKIIRPLRDLAGHTMKQLATDLAAAKGTLDPELLAGDLTKIGARQEQVRSQMETIMAEMIKVENAQQVEHGLKVLIEMSEKVKNLTGVQKNQEPTSAPGK